MNEAEKDLPLILASASKARQQILRQAGLEFSVVASKIDEAPIKQQGKTWSVTKVALELAAAKAKDVSLLYPNSWVIGADQMLALGRKRLDKPETLAKLDSQLRLLRGKKHRLISAVTLVKQGECLWQHYETAHLTMRDFSDEFLASYIAKVGEDARHSVGGYQCESLGSQLFHTIKGDYFTILGLPLIALLNALRHHHLISR